MRRLLLPILALLLCSTAALAQTPANRRVADAPKTAILTGQVVRTDNAEPIAKANVYLTRDGADRRSPASTRKTETDSRGAFSFDHILPGRYIITARLPGFVGSRGGDASSVTFSLGPGDEARTLLRLAPTPVIVGRVLDEDGVPLREAAVKVLSRSSSGLRVLRSAVTDERGEYRVYGFPPGRHIVCAAFNDRRKTDMRYVPRCFPDTSDVADASTIRFVPGAETPLNFILGPEKTVTVRGVVSGVPALEGKLVAGVHVRLEPTWQAVSDDSHEATVQQAAGDFALHNVLPGTYRVIATAILPKDTLVFLDTIEIKESEDNVLAFHLTPDVTKPVNVHSFVEFELPELFPPRSVQVEFRPVHSPAHPDGPLPPTSRPELIPNPEVIRDKAGKTGAYYASFRARLENSWTYVPLLTAKPAGTYLKAVVTRDDRELPATGFVATTDMSLDFFLSTNPVSLEGVVVDEDGKPAADSVVLARSERGEIFREATDQKGHFMIEGLAPGTYRVFAFDSLGYLDQPDAEFLEPYTGLGQDVKATLDSRTSANLKLIHFAEDGR